MNSFLRLVTLALVLAGLVALIGTVVVLRGGISARVPPGRIEAAVAGRLRALAIPRSAEDLRNPVAATPAVVREGMEHFADHCAVCHGNDGSGDTEMGRGLYPRPPDMRKPGTQSLSDGTMFYIIQNGVRFTGMPGWGSEGEHGDEATWHLVHFIRHLPRLTAAERRAMSELNPKTPEERREAGQERHPEEGHERHPGEKQ